jgi:acetyltransferase-like isoleucine patch superfamily enzyme
MKLRTIYRATWSMRFFYCKTAWRYLVTILYYRFIFNKLGIRSVIFRPIMIINSEYISIGSRTTIRDGSRLEVVLRQQEWRPELVIGNNVNIEQNVHIVCQDRIIIEDDVSITGQCAIVDTTHPILSNDKMGDKIENIRSVVRIGKGSFIGFGVTILPNVEIGEYCVIGAGSVVSSNIPSKTVAVGSPARVIANN